jgi:hypothetical protein
MSNIPQRKLGGAAAPAPAAPGTEGAKPKRNSQTFESMQTIFAAGGGLGGSKKG